MMLKRFMTRSANAFGKRYDYDTAYMRDVINVSTSAGWRLSLLPLLSQFRGPNPEVWAGAILASTLEGDCGPCAQLVIDMSVEAGFPPAALKNCIASGGNTSDALGLGFRFAMAAINDTPECDNLREEIRSQWGDEAVVAVSFASALGRVYPVLKRGLGHGKTCQKLSFGSEENWVREAAE